MLATAWKLLSAPCCSTAICMTFKFIIPVGINTTGGHQKGRKQTSEKSTDGMNRHVKWAVHTIKYNEK